MEKRYQVFVSSTYTDLVTERQTAMLRLLEMDCIPTGMELFPASDESAWELIESVIKASDYYMLIIGGRYGSKSTDNPLSFTEREYDLAVKLEIPILTFVHEDPSQLKAANTEQTDDGRAAFDQFRRKASSGKHVKYWKTADDLGGKVVLAVSHAKKTRPRIGWIRADQAADPQTLKDLERVRREADELRTRLAQIESSGPSNGNLFVFDDSMIDVVVDFDAYERAGADPHMRVRSDHQKRTESTVCISWRNAFRLLGPETLVPASESHLYEVLRRHCARSICNQAELQQRFPSGFQPHSEAFSQIKIQFLALGLWEVLDPSGQSNTPFWRLTAYGRTVLTELIAVTRKAL